MVHKLSNTPSSYFEVIDVPCRHAPIYLWYTLTRKGYHGMRKDVEKCLRNAHILKVQHYSTFRVSQLCSIRHLWR